MRSGLERAPGPTPVILRRHIFPNIANTLMVITSLMVGQIILLEAALSFLGLGLSPGAPAWGIMVAEGQQGSSPFALRLQRLRGE